MKQFNTWIRRYNLANSEDIEVDNLEIKECYSRQDMESSWYAAQKLAMESTFIGKILIACDIIKRSNNAD